jgi:hypothetical protein
MVRGMEQAALEMQPMAKSNDLNLGWQNQRNEIARWRPEYEPLTERGSEVLQQLAPRQVAELQAQGAEFTADIVVANAGDGTDSGSDAPEGIDLP